MSPAQASLLMGQQARLITALENMASVIHSLESKSASQDSAKDGGAAAPSHCDASGDFDLNETLERYAPCQHNDGSATKDDLDISTEYDHVDTGRVTGKRRRINSRAAATSAPATKGHVQAANNDSESDQDSRASGLATLVPGLEMSAGLTNSDGEFAVVDPGCLGSDPYLSSAMDTTMDDLPMGDSYTSFMAMLQNVTKPPSMMHALTDTTPDNNQLPTVFDTDAGHPSSGPLNEPRYMHDHPQMLPLIDMVDWDASLQSCVELLSGTYNPSQWSYG
ncbi:hypothetical protein MBLNU459_g8516t2 [Dothideomycetes sp. NU459]